METLQPKDASRLGISKSTLYRGAHAGKYERIARGIYRSADALPADWEWIEAATRRPDATICLTSALAYHDLTDTIPDAFDVAIPRGARIPRTDAAISWHSFATATFDLGRTTIPIPGAELCIGIYSPERSIADAFRLRGDLGYELGRDALREWLRRGGKPAQLLTIATQLPRTKQPVMQALDMLA